MNNFNYYEKRPKTVSKVNEMTQLVTISYIDAFRFYDIVYFVIFKNWHLGCVINTIKLFYYIFKSYFYQSFYPKLIISLLFQSFSLIFFFYPSNSYFHSNWWASPLSGLNLSHFILSHPIDLMIKEICHKIKFYGYQSVWFRLKI